MFRCKEIYTNLSLSLLFLEVFDNYMQQDAHEFLNFLLNTVADLLQSKLVLATISMYS